MPARLRLAGLLSLALHLLIAAALLWRPQFGAADRAAAPDQPVAVELVMQEQQGAGETTTQAAAQPQPPAPEQAPAQQPSPDTAADNGALPPNQPAPPREAARPVPPSTQGNSLRVNLGGTDSESNTIVSGGDNVIPASLDDKARNRPPPYPEDAARANQQGAVVVVIHVSPGGYPEGVDVAESSGYPALDRAAREAVRNWHFRPAMKDGKTIPFDMMMRFLFTAK